MLNSAGRTQVTDLCDRERLSETLPDADLIESATGRRPGLDRAQAIKELVRRRSPGREPVLAALVRDPKAPEDLRSTAALALGRTLSPGAQDALVAALGATSPLVVRRAAEGLGRIGDRRALDALAKVQVGRDGATARGLRFARSLISYRLGLASPRLDPPPAADLLALDQAHSLELRFEPVAADAFRLAAESIRDALPAIQISEQGSVRFACRSERLWIVLGAEAAGADGMRRLAARDGVAAIVLKESTCPSGWYVYEYILAHAQDAKRLALFGVRPSGETLHFGEVALGDSESSVRLHALNTPLVPPIDFEARVGAAGRGFAMTRASVATVRAAGQKRAAVPTRQRV
jgi:hypothetical protein